ncbi:hypothetical protein HK098_001183 [Nowakowskiella sp. JEL0407]|nr:hypothetical protein HK098_001183 [Nowakowskiella sp. JEL0407]
MNRLLSPRIVSSQKFLFTSHNLSVLSRLPKFACSCFNTRFQSIPSLRSLTTEAANDSLSSVKSSLLKIQSLQQSREFSDPNWVNRINAVLAGFDSPFKVLVTGEVRVGVPELVNALIEPQSGSVIPEGLNSNDRSIIKVKYGEHNQEISNDVKTIAYASEWLKDHNVEIISVPSLNDYIASEKLVDLISTSDYILFVTDPTRQLDGYFESTFIKKHIKNRPANTFSIAINGDISISETLIPNINQSLSSNLQITQSEHKQTEEEQHPPIPSFEIFPVNISQIKNIPVSASNYETEWAKSGLRDLKNRLITVLKSRVETRASSVSSITASFYDAIQEDVKKLESFLEELKDSHKQLADFVEEEFERLHKTFELKEVSVLEEEIAKWKKDQEEYFKNVPVWMLFLGTDMIAGELKNGLQKWSLGKVEEKMVYSTARVNEGLHYLYSTIRSRIVAPIHPSDSKLDEHPIIQSLRTSQLQTLSLIDKIRPPVTEIDEAVLKNVVEKVDESRECDKIEKNADSLVKWTVYGQLGVLTTSMLATHFGVPVPIVLPSALFASAQLDESALEIFPKSERYAAEFKQKVTDPIKNILKSDLEGIEKCKTELEKMNSQLKR